MKDKNEQSIKDLMETILVCVDESHDEQVKIEAVQYNEFLENLIDMQFKIGVIKAPPITLQKLSDYDILIIGTPKKHRFSSEEIKTIKDFVYNGGGLFILNDQGGDVSNESNLNDLAGKFGIKFRPNTLLNQRSKDEDEQLVFITDFYQNHFIMRDIECIALKSTCSMVIEDVPGVETSALAFSSLSTDEVYWDGSSWVENTGKKHVVAAVAKYGGGKVVALGTTRILSSLINIKHGIKAKDNEKFLNNIMAWLVNKEVYEDGKLKSVFVNVKLKPDLYFFIEKELKQHNKFRDFNEIINFSLEALKRGIDRYRKSS
ncbi:MAG: Gldg family protein [Promethearchaeota archaeon]